MEFRFTLFNACTLLVMLVTVGAAAWQIRAPNVRSNTLLICYAVLLGYTFGFKYSLNPYVVVGGFAIAVAMRIWALPKLWGCQAVVLGHALFRGAQLLLGK